MRTKLVAIFAVIVAVLNSVCAQEFDRVLEIHKDGEVIFKYNINDVDSVIFNKEYKYLVSTTVVPSNAGLVTINGKEEAQYVTVGDTVAFLAIESSAYQFKNWSVAGEVVSVSRNYKHPVSADLSIVATFEERTTPMPNIIDPIESLTNDELVYVEGGSYTMGATEEQGLDANFDEKPTRKVNLSSYYIGKYEVTQQLWEYVMSYSGEAADGTTMSAYSADAWLDKKPSSTFGVGDYFPTYYVSYDDIVNIFLPRLNKITGDNYRLPTEAEWEYAARGGCNSQAYKYSGSDTVGDVAWFSENSNSKSRQVGTKQPNELGIYDMSGNVWEWCSDWYAGYTSSEETNPTGSESGSYRVFRGGYWGLSARDCRVSVRSSANPTNRNNSVGFRLALSM